MPEWDAGRDLDGFIAERLQGYRVRTVGADAHKQHGGTAILVPPTISDEAYIWLLPNIGPVHRAFFVPCWSTEWRPFPELLAWLQQHGTSVLLNWAEDVPVWEVSWISDGVRYVGFAAHLRLAVCRALAKAAEADTP
jgi:hypothetical protein